MVPACGWSTGALLLLFIFLFHAVNPSNADIAVLAKKLRNPVSRFQGGPTLLPARNFSASDDADSLRGALSNVVDEDTILGILTKRTDRQRIQIVKEYRNLTKELHWKTDFSFRDLMIGLATPLSQFYVSHLKEALRFSTSINEDHVVELLCTLDNQRLRNIKDTYKRVTGRTIRDDLTKYSHNKFAIFLASYLEGRRNESRTINQSLVMDDANHLKNSSRLQLHDGSPFRNILISRSFTHLAQVFAEYRNITGQNIVHAIERDFSGNVKAGLIYIVKTIVRRPLYFAEILHEHMKGISTRDGTLIRVLITRSEIDMENIKEAYTKAYGSSLYSVIWKKTSSSFRKGLLSLIADP